MLRSLHRAGTREIEKAQKRVKYMTMTDIRPVKVPLFIEQMNETQELAERLGPEIAKLWNEYEGPKYDDAGKPIRVTLVVAELVGEHINQHPRPGTTFHKMVQDAFPGERDCKFTIDWMNANYTGNVFAEAITPFSQQGSR